MRNAARPSVLVLLLAAACSHGPNPDAAEHALVSAGFGGRRRFSVTYTGIR